MEQEENIYNQSAREVVELGNRLVNEQPEADLWEVADGLLAGALHYWLYARQPCDDPLCEECEPINTAEQRLAELLRMVEQSARESDYFHSPNDMNVGRA